MQINNLNINILYYLCNPDNGQDRGENIRYADVVSAFADIPEDHIRSTVDAMIGETLVTMDRKGPTLSITKNGIHRLQTSIACRIHRFESCNCD